MTAESTARDQSQLQVTASHEPSPTHRLPHVLNDALAFIDSLGQAFASPAGNLRHLLERLREQRFHLAVLGQFKRGKSTLLNALLGEEILPASVIPLTVTPTFIQAGEERRAQIVFGDGSRIAEFSAASAKELHDFLAEYVTEEANPANRRGVSRVEVFHPAAILHEGAVFIDTPGIGSTHRHSTEAALNFLPQCDAALFVISSDPPITEAEIEFLQEVRHRVSRVFFLLNKMDYLNSSDRDKVLRFIREVLRDQAGLGDEVPVIPVSAKLGLEARQSHDAALWEHSGMSQLEKLLTNFLSNERENVLNEAIARRTSDILEDVLLELRLSVRSLHMPLHDLEERLEKLKDRLAEANSLWISEKDLLEGDKKRLTLLLEEQADRLRHRANEYFWKLAQEALEAHHLDTDAAQKALAEAIPGFFEHELGEMSQAFEAQVRDALRRHRQRTDALIESIRKAAADLFDIPYHPLTSGEDFQIKRRPYWVTRHWPVSFGLLPEGFWDRLLPYWVRKPRAMRRMRERIEGLVVENVENVRWPTLENLEKSFREFGNALDARLEEAVSATKGAIEAIYEKRRDRREAVESEITRLQHSIEKLEQLKKGLGA